MTSSPHGPYVLGYTRATMGYTKGSDLARRSQSQKVARSSDWSLQLDSMKLESLVITDQHAVVNTFPGLVHTAVTPPELRTPEVITLTVRRGIPKASLARGVKS